MAAGNCDLLPCLVPAYAGARVSPWTRATRCQYVLVAAAGLAALCNVLVVCSASPACARTSSSLCQWRWAPANARPAHLVRVWPRVYTPLAVLREQERRNDVPWEERTDLLVARNIRVHCVVIRLMPTGNNVAH